MYNDCCMEPANKNLPFFSIVIPSLNEEKNLPLLLDDLVDQTNDNFEIIHVDGSSEDDTVELAAKYKELLSLTTYVVEKRNVSYQRNFGAEKAAAPWVIFMDADNRLPKYFLDGIKYQIARQPRADVFTTWVNVEDNNARLNQAIEKSINFSFELFKSIGQEAAFGALIGAKREVIEEVVFDEEQKVYEDARFLHQAVEAGFEYRIFREPRYTYSLRRLRKEGTLRMARSTGMMLLKHVSGSDFTSDDHGYVMEGGSYYEEGSISVFSQLNNYIRSASINQLKQARKLFNSLKDL